jgi:pyrroline-5-carboxylate reductase
MQGAILSPCFLPEYKVIFAGRRIKYALGRNVVFLRTDQKEEIEMTYRYGFIGGGNMATALIKGLLSKHQCSAEEILVSDLALEQRDRLHSELKVETTADNRMVASQAECVLLAIKPQTFVTVAQEISGHLGCGKTVISILAGVTTQVLSDRLGGYSTLVRTMPNLPALIGKGVTGIALTPTTPEGALRDAENVLQTVGETVRLPEDLLDAVTAISGSGPGYLFRIAEILISAGMDVGLSEEQADRLVRQTFLGAAEMMVASTESATHLCRKVCSPGGTTLAGLEAMEKGGLESALWAGVLAARNRAQELSKG